MESVAGIFKSRADARAAAERLLQEGVPEHRINLLHPGASDREIESVPTSAAEQPGMGKAIGGAVGAGIGAAAGLHLGTAAAVSAALPGVGPVLAVGFAAAAFLGLGGAVGGIAVGEKLEESTTEGLPADELFFYEDALRQGRSVVFVTAAGHEEAELAREILADSGAESLDAARESWWIGLRSAEEEHYRSTGRAFETDESDYRSGFEAALAQARQGLDFEAGQELLRRRYPKSWDRESFRQGYERGRVYGRERRRR